MWTSVPQIDERRTRIKTSNSPTGGTGISSNQSPGPRSRFTSACIDLIVSGSLCGSLTSLGGDFSQVNESSGLCLLTDVGQRLELSLTLANLPSHLSPLTPHLSRPPLTYPAHHEGKGWSLRLHLPTCLLTSHLSPLTSHPQPQPQPPHLFAPLLPPS